MKIFKYFSKERTTFSLDETSEINLFDDNIQSEIFVEKVKHLKNLNKKFQQGNNLLHFACEYGNLPLAKELISRHINIEEKNDFGNTPLWTAVFNAKGKYEIVDLLLSYNANPNSINHAGNTPLNFAKNIDDKILVQKLSM